MMTKQEIIISIIDSDIFKKWHWLTYHFQSYLYGKEHIFAASIIDALVEIDQTTPGYAQNFIDRIASISGKEKHRQHYEQLLQALSELYVLKRVNTYFSDRDIVLIHEPTAQFSNKNPEFQVSYANTTFGVEVKAPSLINHIGHRYNNPAQISTRVPGLRESTAQVFGDGSITYPRDNPIKDFLISANEKFEGFKRENSDYISILFIMWDDFIYEPISALLGEPSGLFLEGSFSTNEIGNRLTYPYLDAVILDRHLINIIHATQDKPLNDNKIDAMDYGTADDFPFKVIIRNPDSIIDINHDIADCFQVHNLDPRLGAEYIPSDFIFWPHAMKNDE